MSKVSININGREIQTLAGKTVLQAACENGIDIPHLCYDERIKPYGACGLCVVEMEGNPKLVRSCATFAENGQVFTTDTQRTLAARKTALKLLVSDHRGDCRPPCMQACPAHTDCQGYVGLIANGQYEEALKLIKEKIPVPASIGKICPHPCEEACRRQLVEEPISIAALKTFVAEVDLNGDKYLPPVKPSTGKTVAVIGAGPAGLSAAYFLAREGHQAVVYEAMPNPGGMLRYGIPQYRLDKALLDAEISLIEKLGVKFIYNTRIGKDITLAYLKENYDAVFVAVGSWQSQSIRCKGDDMEGVAGGIDFLREVALHKKVAFGEKILVVGGGNTAMDVARTCIRLGADEVTVLYRRTRDEMPAEKIEIEEAMEEGVKFEFLVAPIEVLGENGRVTGLQCEVMRLGLPDASGRRKPEPTGETKVYPADRIIAAIGQKTNVGGIDGVVTDKNGNIIVEDGTFKTNLEKVFAGGEAATGPRIAIDAIAQGRNAAKVIESYLRGNIIPHVESQYISQKDITAENFQDREKEERIQLRPADAVVRSKNFMQVASTYTEEDALRESKRCLECGCRDYFECQLIKYVQEYGIDTDEEVKGETHNRREIDEHPFIERNADKCILCGLCVRACDEIVGASALGLVDRGFNSIVKPEFEMPLKDSACISCGQCVEVCPVGACMEKQASDKQVPVDFDSVSSVCGYCGVGCKLQIEYKGDMIFRATPDNKNGYTMLCKRGKFGLGYINDPNRLCQPIVKRKGRFVVVNAPEAELEVVKRLQTIVIGHGKDSVGIVVSPRLTNEELFVAGKIADKLQTNVKASFSVNGGSGLADVFGYDASTNSYDEIGNSDLVLTFGDVKNNHPVLDFKVRLANVPTFQWPADFANTADLKAFAKALIDMGAVDEQKVAGKAQGYEEFKASLAAVTVNDAVKAAAEKYSKAKKPIIVIDEDTISADAVKLIASIALIAGKVGAPYRGIILVRTKNNTQGTVDMGFTLPAESITKGIESGKIKALVIIGEDPAFYAENAAVLSKLSFLAVYDMFMTETAKIADVVVPIVSAFGSEGTYTRSDRRIQEIGEKVSMSGEDNLETLLNVLQYFSAEYANIGDIQEAISEEVANYGGLNIAPFATEAVYWPNSKVNPRGTQVLYSDGFATADKKAVLKAVADGPVFVTKPAYDSIEMYFAKIGCKS